ATYQGKLRAVPWFNNGPGLYSRKDPFAARGLKPPKTYDELHNAAIAGLLFLADVEAEMGVSTLHPNEFVAGQSGPGRDALDRRRFLADDLQHLAAGQLAHASADERRHVDAAGLSQVERGVGLERFRPVVSVMASTSSSCRVCW